MKMPTNELLESHRGAKEALRQLKLSKESNDDSKKEINSSYSATRKNKPFVGHKRKHSHSQNQPSTSKHIPGYNINIKVPDRPGPSTSKNYERKDGRNQFCMVF